MRRGTIFFFFLFFLIGMLPDASAEVDLNNITIYRDNYGVPHIHAKSDEELAYGLAWATAEDDFGSIQENVLAVRGRLAEVQGKKGAIMDFIAFALGLNEQVEKEFEQQTSPEFRSVMEAYVRAINRYAELHPKEVKLKKLFPVSSKDLMAGYMLGMAFIANAQEPLTQIFSGSIKIHEAKLPKGSNAIAISPKKSADGGTYVAINSHQPLVGPYSWYEAHLVNDKVNMHGATFPGGMSLFVGANEHFAWAHTVNHPDFNDVYKLEMHPNKKLTYKYDGQWKTLKQRTKKIKVKVWFFKVRAKRTFYWSEYGPTIKTDDGFYSVRMPSIYEMASAEQWHHMNRATDWASFRATLDQQGHCGTNLIYGDKEGHIYYVS
ncbi:MAG: penicillin acylase family protein, partial [Bacteroidota bacterium]